MNSLTLEILLDGLRWLIASPHVWRGRLDTLTILFLLTLVGVSGTDPMVLLRPVAVAGAILLAGYSLVSRAERQLARKYSIRTKG